MKAYLNRNYYKEQTTGTFFLFENDDLLFECHTLEPPDLNNQENISCIPEGEYECTIKKSPKYGNCFHIKNVKDRANILIHHGNYKSNTKGCILVGLNLTDINNDGLVDVTDSKNTRKKLESITDNFTLTIRS